MKQFFTHNLGWKLLSLVIAVAIWIAVAREPELATSLSVPVELKNIPDDLDIGSSVPDRVHLEIRGPSGRLSRDNLADAAMILDLADAHAGERTYTVRATNFNLPTGVSFYRAVPSQITLRFDHLASQSVKIFPRYSKPPQAGYRIRAYVLEPENVRIRGPEERVKRIDRVWTDPVDLSNVVSAAEFHTHVNVGDAQVRLDAPTAITLKVTLERSASQETK
ncbi:MAG TPA: CdaR family protein [Bryobacteraceae bacterium]|nr:CdaR family protein [Bryobacteraceae bacterium]